MKNKSFLEAKSLFYKKIKFKDIFLNIVLISSFIFAFSIFIIFLIFIILKALPSLNFKLIYSIVNNTQKGILPIIINTVYIVILTLLLSVPIGIAAAIYITEYSKSKKILKFISFLINILSSTPTLLIGLFGYNIFCIKLGLTPSIFVGCLTMSICILPNIIETSKEAILAVPSSYKYGALALGAEKFQVVFSLILPNAMLGIVNAIILAAGKIMGESAIFLFTVGTASKMPSSFLGHIFASGKPLTLHLYLTAGNATLKDSFSLCFAIAFVLIILSFFLNTLTKLISKFFNKSI